MIEILFELSKRNLINEFTVQYNPDSWIFYKEWFFGTNNTVKPTMYHKSKSRFALLAGNVCYLSTDVLKINFEVGNAGHKNTKSVSFSEQLLPKILGQSSLGEFPDVSKVKLRSTIKLFNISDAQKIASLDNICSTWIKNQDHSNIVKSLIDGSAGIYGASINFSEAVKNIGFDGILYKTRTTTDALGPFNDPMLVVYEPVDGRELFENVVLVEGSPK